jgi:hypothetical protein
LLEEQPPGELKPHRFMSEMELYTRWLLACGSKELERVWQLRLLTQTWGGERCGRRQHARRGDKDGSCTRRAATAKPSRGRRGGERQVSLRTGGVLKGTAVSGRVHSGVYESGP